MTFLKSEKLKILNLIFLPFYLLIYMMILTTISTIVDESFARGTYEDFTENINSSIDALPWSLWSIIIALSDIVEEILSDFALFDKFIFSLAIPPTIISYYCAKKGRMKGILIEQDVWLKWYKNRKSDDREIIADNLPTLSGSILMNSQLPRLFIILKFIVNKPRILTCHLLYHLIAYSIFIPIRSIFLRMGFEIDLILLFILILLTTICSVVSSYIEANSIINGAESERQVWTKWYFRNFDNISQEKHNIVLPNLGTSNVYIPFDKLRSKLKLIFNQPISIIIHFVFWIICSQFLVYISYGSWDSFNLGRSNSLLMSCTLTAIFFTFITAYRKAIGRQRGIVQEQKQLIYKYSNEFQEKSPEISKKSIYSTYDSFDIYCLTLQESVSIIFRKPHILIFHFFGLVFSFIFIYGFTNRLYIESHDNSVQLLIVILLTFIISILETQQEKIGMIHERRIWTDWYHKSIEEKIENLHFTELTP
ncbi:hypothetical protein JT359_18760 [Candidatus Poribacteria bacterium]|nr:hypothetical protein [Candidatus Poribacteria bacterium]